MKLKSEKSNLIIFHLESISSNGYFQNLALLEDIERIRRNSWYFPNYFSTATSTIMVIADLLFGDQYAFETSENLNDFRFESREKNLLRELEENGYVSKAFYTPILTGETNLQDFPIIFGDLSDPDYSYSYSEFCDAIEKVVAQDKPFAIYVDDSITHVSYRDDGRNYAPQWHEKYLKALENINRTVSDITDFLDKYQKNEHTVLLFVGDHGDSYWNYGLYDGYTHAIPPYPDIIQTPLFVYIPWERPKVCSHLIATVDLKKLIQSIMNGNPQFPKREYVFSRNLFVNQGFASDFLHKGYSLTNGTFIITLDRDGLQMFPLVCGYNSSCNLLDFFQYKSGTLRRPKYLSKLNNEHAQYNLRPLLDEVENQFPVLLQALQNEMEVLCKYSAKIIPYRSWMSKIHYVHQYRHFSRCHNRMYYAIANFKQTLLKKEIIHKIWNAVK